MSKIKKQGVSQSKILSKKVPETFFVRAEAWMDKRSNFLFYLILSLCFIFSLLLFNVRISEGGDDSAYILAAKKYSEDFFNYYFSFNAPLYPMFLSLPVSIFGINVPVLKAFSLLFNILHTFFMFRAFKNRISKFILFPILFFISINSYFLYFASQTYTESFFLFLSSLFLYLFFKHIDLLEAKLSKSVTFKSWLLIGFLAFLITMSKNIALTIVPAMVLFFALKREYLNALYSIIAFAIFKVPFEILKKLIWGDIGQYGSQGAILLQKDPYDPSKGTDDIAGFIGRFFDNIDLYLSKRFFQILGLRSEDSIIVSTPIAFLVIFLLLFGFYKAWKNKNHYLFFGFIYVFSMMCASFLVLQARWDQLRLLLVYVPILLIVILYGVYDSLKRSSSFSQNFYILLLAIILLPCFFTTIGKSKENIPILSKNLKGDIYYGYTPDWVNYLKLSEWCAESLPDTSYVACRKSPMSFIYGKGKEFYPVYTVKQTDPDSVLATFKKDKVTHVIIASLRRDEKKNDGNVINTLHRMLQPIVQKYPDKVRFIRQEGKAEPAYLYEIKY